MEWVVWSVAGLMGVIALTALVNALENCFDY
jgi:hypothetical protein